MQLFERLMLVFLAVLLTRNCPAAAAGLLGSRDLFDERRPVLQLRIRISETNVLSLSVSPRTYVPVTIVESGVIYTNVALRLKGNEGGSFRPLDDKPALTLNFDKFEKDQLFHGYDKMYLNNSVEDGSYMNEFLSGELFRASGVPAPRIAYAMVEINGRSRGLYVLKEGFNKRFLRKFLGNGDGNFYDGGYVTDIDQGLRRSSGDGPEDNADLMGLAAAARETDSGMRWDRMGALLDMDRFITFMAMEVLLGHWDGYTMNRNNYRVYNHPGRGIVFIPHGMDIMFSEPGTPPAPFMDGLVSRAVIETAEGKRRYYARLMELRDQVFKLETITNRVGQLRSRVRPSLAKIGLETALSHDDAVKALLEKIALRDQVIRGWGSNGEVWPLDFDGSESGELTGWRPRDETLDAVLTRSKPGLLGIVATTNPQGRPSWRTSVFLEPGDYRFLGKVKTEGVKPRVSRVGEGAGIRVAGMGGKRFGLSGDSDWRELGFDFRIESGTRLEEVELVCELIAIEGRAWFDGGSLRLVRVKSPPPLP